MEGRQGSPTWRAVAFSCGLDVLSVWGLGRACMWPASVLVGIPGLVTGQLALSPGPQVAPQNGAKDITGEHA